MARITIDTRDLGPLEFWVLDTGGKVRIESGREHGILGTLICAGGRLRGHTLTASAATLAIVARRWNKQRRANLRNL